MFNWIKSNPWKSAGIAILLIYVIVSMVKKQWNPMNWFSSTVGDGATQRAKCLETYDSNCATLPDGKGGWKQVCLESCCRTSNGVSCRSKA